MISPSKLIVARRGRLRWVGGGDKDDAMSEKARPTPRLFFIFIFYSIYFYFVVFYLFCLVLGRGIVLHAALRYCVCCSSDRI